MSNEYIPVKMNEILTAERPVRAPGSGGTAVRVGVLGATGYTGRELVRLLSSHPRAEIAVATSESAAGSSLREIWRAAPERELVRLEDAGLDGCDVIFSCLPHGESGPWVERARRVGARVVDLSADLRVRGPETPEWALNAEYGLPELNRRFIAGAELVANPGCYPTAALLALAPLLRRGAVSGPVIIDAASGVTGAGRSPKRELLYAEVAEDFRAYAVGNVHRHLREMTAQAGMLSEGAAPELVFTPHLLPVRRGILETIHVMLAGGTSPAQARRWLDGDYSDEPFVEVLDRGTPALTDAVGTNRVVLGLVEVSGVSRPIVTLVAAMDNLVKGAAGQAIQNMNLMLGFDETEGLI
jgi:N-acetyl-gamma-glutamyl-phosphate reductase